MEAFKSWAVTSCFAALAAGMAGIIAPKGNLEKTYKFAVSLFFLCCILIPIFSLKKINLSLQLPQTSSSASVSGMDSVIQEQTKAQAEENIETLVRACLKQQGADPVSVSVQMEIGADGTYSVKSVSAVLKPEDMQHKQELAQAVKQSYGLDIKLEVGAK